MDVCCMWVSCAHLLGHVPGEEEVRQCCEEDKARCHQEAEPPGAHPAHVPVVQLYLVCKKKKICDRLFS